MTATEFGELGEINLQPQSTRIKWRPMKFNDPRWSLAGHMENVGLQPTAVPGLSIESISAYQASKHYGTAA